MKCPVCENVELVLADRERVEIDYCPRSLRDSARTIGLWTNPAVYLGIGGLLLLQLGFVYLPFMHEFFGSALLALDAWLVAGLVSAIVLPVISLEKWARKVRHKKNCKTRNGLL